MVAEGAPADAPLRLKSLDRFEDAREYYDFLLNKRTVAFHPHPQKCDAEKYPAFQMVLNSRIGYDKLSEKVGERLGVPPTHLRFYTVNAASGNPRNAVKRGQNQTLHTILVPAGYGQVNMNQRSDELFFEVLDMSLAELDTKKSIKLTLLSEGITKEVSGDQGCERRQHPGLTHDQEQFDILVTKSGQVEDLIENLIKKAKLPSEEEAGRIRIYETSNHKFFRELERNYPVISINDYTSVIAERMPPEDAEVQDPTHFISVFHFQGEPSRPHGIPFRFLLKEGERFAETKKRLEKRTGLKGKSFEKIKFAVVRRAQFSRPQYLTDGELRDCSPIRSPRMQLTSGDRRYPLGRGSKPRRCAGLRPPRPDEVIAERRWGPVSQGLDSHIGICIALSSIDATRAPCILFPHLFPVVRRPPWLALGEHFAFLIYMVVLSFSFGPILVLFSYRGFCVRRELCVPLYMDGIRAWLG